MIDDSSVVIGDVRLADDVGIWPLVVIRGEMCIRDRFKVQAEQQRLEAVTGQVTQAEQSLADAKAATEKGFQYSQHFNRIFKKNVGYTPGEYRKLQI